MDGGRWPNGEKVVTELEVGGWRLSGKPWGLTTESPVELILTHVNVGKSIWMTCVGESRKAQGEWIGAE